MEYITRAKGGYMVRKRINGILHQTFFGDTNYGNSYYAKQAAVEFRNELIKQVDTEDAARYRLQNKSNRTGVIGVAWFPPSSELNTESQKHNIRARATYPNNPNRLQTSSWSVYRYGLWNAYTAAVNWRYQAIYDGEPADLETLIERFKVFINHYLDLMRNEEDISYSGMMDALRELISQHNVPDEVVRYTKATASEMGIFIEPLRRYRLSD